MRMRKLKNVDILLIVDFYLSA